MVILWPLGLRSIFCLMVTTFRPFFHLIRDSISRVYYNWRRQTDSQTICTRKVLERAVDVNLARITLWLTPTQPSALLHPPSCHTSKYGLPPHRCTNLMALPSEIHSAHFTTNTQRLDPTFPSQSIFPGLSSTIISWKW